MQKTQMKATNTRETILLAAIDLMVSKGYNDTSLDMITAKTKITKGGFFHYFKSKEDMALEAAQFYMDCRQEKLAKAPFNAIAEPLGRLFGFLDFLITESHENRGCCGCLLGTLAQELSYTNTKVQKACAELFRQWAESMGSMLRDAQKQNSKASVNPRETAVLFISLLEGSWLMARAQRNPEIIEKNLKWFRRFLQQAFSS